MKYKLLILVILFSIKIFSQYRVIEEYSGPGYSEVIIDPGFHGNLFSEIDDAVSYSFLVDFAVPYNSKSNFEIRILEDAEFDPKSLFGDKLSDEIYLRTVSEIRNLGNYRIKGYTHVGKNYCAVLEIPRLIINNLNELRIVKKISIKAEWKGENFTQQTKLNVEGTTSAVNRKTANQLQTIPVLRKSDGAEEWFNYNQTYLKFGTAKDGIYRINYNDLQNQGIDPTVINPKTIKVYNKGLEVPIFLEGEDDAIFDVGDFIEFFGIRNMGGKHRDINAYNEPYNEYLGQYTDTTAYFLTWGGDIGLRVKVKNDLDIQILPDTLRYYYEIARREINNWYDYPMQDQVEREKPFQIDNKTWIDISIPVGTRNIVLSLSNIYPDQSAFVYSKIMDYASSISTKAHLLAIGINSYPEVYDSTWINKYQRVVMEASFSSSKLVNGNNTVKIFSYPVAGNTVNSSSIDWTELEYPRYIKMINDSLLFKFTRTVGREVHGFIPFNLKTNDYSFWKYDKNPVKYKLTRRTDSLYVADTLDANSIFAISSVSKILKPKFYYAKQFTNLRNVQNKADYLAITHKKYLQKAEEYVQFISDSYDVEAKVIDVHDIYDEFAYGYFNPESIRDFLQAANSNWQTPLPEYVCLIGNATYDYHGNKAKYRGAPPVYNDVPSFGAPVSDNWFVTWDSLILYNPQMFIGRIPVRSNQEFEFYFAKHRDYVQQPYNEWNKRYIFFSGGKGDSQSELNQLKGINDFIINNYVDPAPVGGTRMHFYKTISPVSNFGPYTNAEISSTINKGSLFISYIGHSGTQTWDNSITSVSQLKNTEGRYPLITDFGCSTGKFAEPDILSFSQLFLLDPNGSAIGYIGNASLGFFSTATTAPQIFYRNILRDSVVTISKALTFAKRELYQNNPYSGTVYLFALTNSFLGDPIIKLPVPPKPNLMVAESSVITDKNTLIDNRDSTEISIDVFNFGKVGSDSVIVKIDDFTMDTLNYSASVMIPMPLYKSTIKQNIPILGKSGLHKLSVSLDPDNLIDELSKSDNFAEVLYNVSSFSYRTAIADQSDNLMPDSTFLINPSRRPASEIFQIEISENAEFTGASLSEMQADTFRTELALSSLENGKRYWLRAKVKGANSWGNIFSFIKGQEYGFSVQDSIGYAVFDGKDLQIKDNKVNIGELAIQIKAISAGFYDGTTASIEKNGQNYIPSGNLRAHHVVVFDDSTYEFKQYGYFNVSSGAVAITNYISLLDAASENDLIVIAVSNDGLITDATLRDRLRNLGSKYIDSLVFTGSWAIIGKKGAPVGSVPEAFSKPYGGRVEIDTTYYIPLDSANFITREFGPASEWKHVTIDETKPAGSEIKYNLYGMKKDGLTDTLGLLDLSAGEADISSIDAKIYRKLKIAGDMYRSPEGLSPELSGLQATFSLLPELGANYQTVTASDTIFQGKSNSLKLKVFNAGGADADSFTVRINFVKEDNTKRLLIEKEIPGLKKDSSLTLEYDYGFNYDDGYGNTSFEIITDALNSVDEIYEDNNTYVFPFYIIKDTSIVSVSESSFTVKIDGRELFNGEYVSSNPQIEIDFSYPFEFPIEDNSAVLFKLNDRVLAADSMVTDSIQRKRFYYTKPVLTDSTYTLTVEAKEGLGMLRYKEVNFIVDSGVKLIDLFNYPNPCKGETHFTFKLTQVPDEMSIRIFTVAGRLIKKISLNSADLKSDFNKIYWNGKDEDGNDIANGTYLYKVILKKGDKTESRIQKLSIVR